MKYCSKCKKVYPDGIDCECIKEKRYSWEKPVTMIELDCDAKCKKCGSVEALKYHEPYKYTFVNLPDSPAYCECSICEKKLQDELARQESMKYLILDYYRDETKFCDSKDDVLILKLEPEEGRLKEADFKPVFENYNPDTKKRDREPNTHIVFWDGEVFRVEEVIVPELEYDGGRSINW